MVLNYLRTSNNNNSGVSFYCSYRYVLAILVKKLIKLQTKGNLLHISTSSIYENALIITEKLGTRVYDNQELAFKQDITEIIKLEKYVLWCHIVKNKKSEYDPDKILLLQNKALYALEKKTDILYGIMSSCHDLSLTVEEHSKLYFNIEKYIDSCNIITTYQDSTRDYFINTTEQVTGEKMLWPVVDYKKYFRSSILKSIKY